MALYANRPFAIAPYIGENAFTAVTVCKVLGFSWQTALAAIFIAGIAFVLLTVLHLRQWIVDGVPTSLRYSFVVGIGLFLTFISWWARRDLNPRPRDYEYLVNGESTT